MLVTTQLPRLLAITLGAALTCTTLLSGTVKAETPRPTWCMSEGARLADNRQEEAGKTSAWRRANMPGHRYCTRGAALVDIEFAYDLHGIAFLPPGSPGIVVCTYPFTKSDIDDATIGQTFIEASYTVTGIKSKRSDDGVLSTSIQADCHKVRLHAGWMFDD